MTAVYDYKLVALSLAVAIIASYTALDLAGRVSATTGRRSSLWLLGGAFSMGTGIWSMHFIGMLAFHLSIAIAYDIRLNALSWLIAVVVSGIALFVVRRPSLTGASLGIGAALMGLGISAMHYTGMAAMQMSPPITYRPSLFVASVLIAIGASLAALWIAFELRKRNSVMAVFAKLGSAAIMGVAITGMHYTGMEAAQFAPDSICLASGSNFGLTNSALASLIALATVIILAITLILSAFDAHLAARHAKQAASLEAANLHLRNIALYDNLTGLPNRLLLEDRVEQAIAHARRAGKPCALMFVDLDNFKPVNDTFGHPVGDELLKAVGGRLTNALRQGDTVARVGGDEFIIVLSELTQVMDATVVGDKLLQDLARPFVIGQRQLNVTCSVGISIYPTDGASVKDLLTCADVAMYQVKKSGRNGYRLFERGMDVLASPSASPL